MSNAIIYSPFLDWTILKELKEYAKKYSKDPSFTLTGKTDLHKTLAALSPTLYDGVPRNAGPFQADSIVGDHTAQPLFEAFIKKNDFSLEIPIPPEPKDIGPAIRTIFISSAAIMSLVTKWPSVYGAEKKKYEIDRKDSFSGTAISVNGFHLSKIQIGVVADTEVSAIIDLENGFEVRIFDITAFEDGENLLRTKRVDFNSLMQLKEKNIVYPYDARKGYLYCPSVDAQCHVHNHLAGIVLKNNQFNGGADVQEIIIDNSELLGKLELSEWGIKAKVEVVAASGVLFGVSASSFKRTYVLRVQHGLVVKILYRGKELFIAYVPQELFKKNS